MLSSRSAACASAVTEALAAAGEPENMESGETRGESLLLPLLQGLLGGAGDKLLAGLGAAPADVVADVRRSLARLRAALAPPTAHPQARALLTLADRLEDALDAADRSYLQSFVFKLYTYIKHRDSNHNIASGYL